MIKLYGFGRVHRKVIGETRDLRVQWALEEVGLRYEVIGLDHTAGELAGEAFSRINPFHQLPVIDDDGFIVAESGAAVLYIAEKASKLIPADLQGRTRVVQWCFAALNTVERPLLELQLIDHFAVPGAEGRRPQLLEQAGRWLAGLETTLEDRQWLASKDFTVADLLLASVLRGVRRSDLLTPYPRLTDYYARAMARPAWQRTLLSYADRLGVKAADIR